MTTTALAVSIHTVEMTMMGDHAERIPKAHRYLPGETIEDLVARVFPKLTSPHASHDAGDVIELRVIVDLSGTVSGEPPRSDDPPW